jgi:hypothetical protein
MVLPSFTLNPACLKKSIAGRHSSGVIFRAVEINAMVSPGFRDGGIISYVVWLVYLKRNWCAFNPKKRSSRVFIWKCKVTQ